VAVRTRTLAQLRAEVRQRADIENDPHITDAEVDRFINQSCAGLHSAIVDAGSGFYTKSTTGTLTSGSETLALPANTYRVVKFAVQVSGVWRSIRRATMEKFVDGLNAATWGMPSWPTAYIIIDGNTMTFSPIPDSAYPYRVLYVRSFFDMSGDSDVFDGEGGWEEWVVLDAAIKCVTKEEGSITDLQAERGQVWTRISSQFASEDMDHPPTVRDTESSYDQWWPRRGSIT